LGGGEYMKIILLRHFPFNKLSFTAKPHLQKSVKPVLKSQSFRALLEVLSSQNGHNNTNMAFQESIGAAKIAKKIDPNEPLTKRSICFIDHILSSLDILE